MTLDSHPEIPDFDLHEVVGEGWSGVVFRATQRSLGRTVALKLLHPERMGEDRARARLRREATLLARIRHPGLVPLLDADLDGAPPWIAFAFMEGGDLSSHVEAATLLPSPVVLEAGARVAGALVALHDQDVLHRDVKPANLLRDGEGRVYLGDLGLSRAADQQRLTASGMMVGSMAYLAPEVLRGEEPTRASEVFSLAVVLTELLTGQRPVPSTGGVLMPRDSLARLEDPELLRLLRRSLASDPATRPSSMAEVEQVLADSRERASSPGTHRPPPTTGTMELPPVPSAPPVVASSTLSGGATERPAGTAAPWVGTLLLVVLLGLSIRWLPGGGGVEAGARPLEPAPPWEGLAPGATPLEGVDRGRFPDGDLGAVSLVFPGDRELVARRQPSSQGAGWDLELSARRGEETLWSWRWEECSGEPRELAARPWQEGMMVRLELRAGLEASRVELTFDATGRVTSFQDALRRDLPME